MNASEADEVRFQATGGFVIAPESDSTTMLDVQDKDGNTLLAADTTNHKVQVFDGDATDSVDVSHDGTDGVVSTSTGDLQLSPSGSVSVPTAPSSDDDVLRYQERVESASVTIGGVDNSGNDDSWGQSTTATKTWPNPFSVSNVDIVATIDEDESDVPANEVTVSVKNVTSSDFDIVVHQMAAVDRSEVDYAVNVMIRKGPAER